MNPFGRDHRSLKPENNFVSISHYPPCAAGRAGWQAGAFSRSWRGTQQWNERLAEIGLPSGTVQMFEFIDLDEGRLKIAAP